MSGIFKILKTRDKIPMYNIEELIDGKWYLRAWGFTDREKVFSICHSFERGDISLTQR